MAVLDTIKGWFRPKRDKEPPLERPRDLPPPGQSGGRPHEGPYPPGADSVLGTRGGF